LRKVKKTKGVTEKTYPVHAITEDAHVTIKGYTRRDNLTDKSKRERAVLVHNHAVQEVRNLCVSADAAKLEEGGGEKGKFDVDTPYHLAIWEGVDEDTIAAGQPVRSLGHNLGKRAEPRL
jgi:hypothetical protein